MNLQKKLFIILLLMVQVVSADIVVTVDRSPVHVNESFQLIFESADSPDGDPDFSPLQQLFEVLNTRQSNSINIINGDYKRSVKWVLQVIPKRVGEFVVPAIRFGRDKTEPFSIKVESAATSSRSTNRATIGDLILELSADRESVPVQGQVIVTMRLLSNANISAYQFGDLSIKSMDAVIEPLGDVKQFQTKIGDQAYLVLEKKLAVFPLQKGQFKTEPLIAEVRLSTQSNSYFDPFKTRGEVKRVVSAPLSFEVTGIIPSLVKQHWLPASNVKLNEVWQGDLDKLMAGEPVTRTITLVAEGLTSAQLPEFAQADVKGLKQYPDQPVLNDQRSEQGMVGVRQQKIALIPTLAGDYVLPEMTIPWWNVNTKQQEMARIPARTITVKGEVIAPIIPAQKAVEIVEVGIVESETLPTESKVETQSNPFWVWLSLFLACGWAASILWWWLKRRMASAVETTPEDESVSLSRACKTLQKACSANDPQAAREALLVWANALGTGTQFGHLNQLSQHYGEPFKSQIKTLNGTLYSANTSEWRGSELWQSCLVIMTRSVASSKITETQLANLNPHSAVD